jgi:transposase
MIQIQDMKKLTELYLQGQSLRQIGVHFKVSAKTIERRLKLSGVTLRDKNQAAKEQNAWWQSNQYLKVKYVDEGLSTTDIGKLVNASSGAVHTWLTKLEIPTRPAGGAFKKGTKMSSKSPQRMSEGLCCTNRAL